MKKGRFRKMTWSGWKSVLKNTGITAGILALVTVFCFMLQSFEKTDSHVETHVPLLYVLAVLFISRFTEGYLYGIIASMIAVVGVNFVFTYPYFALNFTIIGYPVTFIAMLAVAISVSALTTQIMKQEQVRLEVEKEKMRGNLLRAVSHDIRTPLTSILGAASGVLENYEVLEKEKKLELISDIKEEAQWLIRVVENLLSITRINGDRARIDKFEEVVEEVISGAVMKFKKQYPAVDVEVKMPEDVMILAMDGILIEQVLVNLMENSVQHGKTTSLIRIGVSEEKDRILFSVEDNGQGIKPAVLPEIFEGNLHAQEGESSDAKRNMGIGLSVCMSIVKAHRGNMKAENLPDNGGARMLFWLPKEDM